MGLRGRVAIVTGGSRGLGKEIAKGLARQGARIVAVARSEKGTDELPGTIYETAEEIRPLGSEALAAGGRQVPVAVGGNGG